MSSHNKRKENQSLFKNVRNIILLSTLYNKQLLNPYKGARQNWGEKLMYLLLFKNFLNLVVHLSSRMTDVENYSRYTINIKQVAKNGYSVLLSIVDLCTDKLWRDSQYIF